MEYDRIDKKKIMLLSLYLDVCNTHASRLKMAYSHVKHLYPMEVGTFVRLKDDEIGFMELLINRFSKLQDVIGAKIFPMLVELLQPETKGSSFLDVLHQLEKLDLLPSSKLWIDMREFCNRLIYECLEYPDFTASNCNQAILASQELLQYWEGLQGKAHNIKEEWNRQLS